MNKKDLVALQREHIAQRQAELDAAQAELDAYQESEAYLRDQWEDNEERWFQKAKKEGWNYVKKPFISALQRQQMEEQQRMQEIAYLKEKLAALEGKNQ